MINNFSILNEAKYFSPGIFQNYLELIPAKNDIKRFIGTTRIESYRSNGMSEENIKNIENITKSDSNFAPTFADLHLVEAVNFNGHCLIKNNIFITKKVINLYISYTLNPQLRNLKTDFKLGNCLFGSLNLTKNADLDKYTYNGCGIRFNSRSEFFFTDGSFGKNVFIFGVDMSLKIKDLHQVYTIMEATASSLLMLQKYTSSKQKSLKQKIMECV